MKKILIYVCLSILLTLQGCFGMWTDENTSFAENMVDLQGGDLRLYQSKGLMFLSYSEPLRMADQYNTQGEVIGRGFAEEWMKDTAEWLNRDQIRLIKGNLNQKAEIIFSIFAQKGSWWTNQDLSKIYISVIFNDYHKQGVIPVDKILGNARIYKMFKSVDSGLNFKPIHWPKARPIIQVLFDQTGQYGYVIGGNRELWRSSDAGETWKKIVIPQQWILKAETDDDISNNIVKTFDAYYLDEKTKTLYLSCFKYDAKQSSNEVYALPWNEALTDMNQLKPIVVIADVYITAIQSAPEQGLYFLTEKFDFSDFNLQSNKKSAQFIYLSKDKKQHLVELGDRLMLRHLYQGKDGVLVIVGSKVSESYLRFEDMYLISTDQGQSWSFHNNESSATGQTFDTQTNRLWKLENAKLYSKQLD